MEDENRDASSRNIQYEMSLKTEGSQNLSDFEAITHTIISQVLAALNAAPVTTASSRLGRKQPRPNSHDFEDDCLPNHPLDDYPPLI